MGSKGAEAAGVSAADAERRCDVLVAGAGLVGLALAPVLARAGLDVVLADRAVPVLPEPLPDSWDVRVYAISPAARRGCIVRSAPGRRCRPNASPRSSRCASPATTERAAQLLPRTSGERAGVRPSRSARCA
ncbi:MAG: FAD-dependent monooxygenase, partial [Betaproteobacteria bacterium]|nr:FAD-dependent monooxygenase [Betaproteobacteria bacterium]